MGKTVLVSFRFDAELYARFRDVSKERGHTMTWYFHGCMREVVQGRRREVKRARKLSSEMDKKILGK